MPVRAMTGTTWLTERAVSPAPIPLSALTGEEKAAILAGDDWSTARQAHG